MTAEAGWYPDPMGDVTKLRYWNGAAWTDDYAPAQTPAGAAPAGGTQPAQAATGTASTAADPNAQATAAAQPAATAAPTPQPTVTVNVQQPAAATPVTYSMTDTDRTLRLIAFILNLLTAIGCCWLIIPLAWQVPMTVRSYGIYKGTKPNTVAMGVCTLIFVNIISGVLLLCSKKDA